MPLKRLLLWAGIGGALALLLSTGAVAGTIWWYGRQVDHIDPNELEDYAPEQVTRVLASDGTVLAELFDEQRRTLVSFDELPPHLVNAFLAAEDASFFDHEGIDYFGVVRATAVNVRHGSLRQGASTITQQVVKNTLLSRERSVERKSKELVLAIRLEQALSKEKIFEVYVNEVYFGEGRYGVEEAARYYFGKSAREVDAGEAAMLAGLVQAPGRRTPYRDLEGTKARQAYVLEQMVDHGFLAIERARPFIERPLDVVPHEDESAGGVAPELVAAVEADLEARFGADRLRTLGATVHTTIDPRLQAAARSSARAMTRDVAERRQTPGQAPQAAVLLCDADDGAVRAWVGGTANGRGDFDRATRARRQPASTFKPIVWAAALEGGEVTAATRLEGVKETLDLRQGLARSDNAIARQLFAHAGAGRVQELARNLGIESALSPYPSLALGASEVTPWEMLGAYLVLARRGEGAAPYFIERIEIPGEGTLRPRPDAPRGIAADLAALTTSLLESVVRDGTARRARKLERPLAGKTGTSNKSRDAWMAGYSVEHVAVVWIGDDEPRSLGRRSTGSKVALPVWMDVMEAAEEKSPSVEFVVPDSLHEVAIDARTGTAACEWRDTWRVPQRCDGWWIFEECRPAHDVAHPLHLACSDPASFRAELFLPDTSPEPFGARPIRSEARTSLEWVRVFADEPNPAAPPDTLVDARAELEPWMGAVERALASAPSGRAALEVELSAGGELVRVDVASGSAPQLVERAIHAVHQVPPRSLPAEFVSPSLGRARFRLRIEI